MYFVKIILFFLTLGFIPAMPLSPGLQSVQHKPKKEAVQWKEGYMDIHHINIGRGNATFIVLPDGTNLLIDAGHIVTNTKAYVDVHPNSSQMPGAWIADYIRQVMGPDEELKIDYFIPTHFHTDHFGQLAEDMPFADNGAYRLSGITEVGSLIPIKKIIDRGYPEYDFPVDLRNYYEHISPRPAFPNYLKFIEYHRENNGMKAEKAVAGAFDQLVLVNEPEKYPAFEVRNLKVNNLFWSGKGVETFEFDYGSYAAYDSTRNYFNENPLSIALKISYGSFDYYTGGDNTGLTNGKIFDMETPLARITGKVEVMTLNHHGYKDASNESFLQALSPDVVVHQSLHDPHFQDNVLKNLKKVGADVFTLNASAEVEKEFGDLMHSNFLSKEGHILIRVYPKGKKFKVLILDDNKQQLEIKRDFGFY